MHGKEKEFTLEFLPIMPPNTVNGKVTPAQISRMTTIVPNGNAAVDL